MARVGMLDVPGHESRHPAATRTLRVNQQPEFRRTPGPRRTHAPGQPHDGGSGGDCRTFYRHKELAISIVMMVERRASRPSRLHPQAEMRPGEDARRSTGSAGQKVKSCNHSVNTLASVSRSTKCM